MAARKKAKSSKRSKKSARGKKTAKRKTKKTRAAASGRASARTKRTKKAAKRKTTKRATKRAKAPAKRKASKGEMGEGNYKASRNFDTEQASFVAKNRDKIPEMGREAADTLDGPEGVELEQAEQETLKHAHG